MNLSIRSRLVFGFACLFIFTAVVGWRGLKGMSSVNEELNSMKKEHLGPAKLISEANEALVAWDRASLNHIVSENMEEMEKYELVMSQQREILNDRLQKLRDMKHFSGKAEILNKDLIENFRLSLQIRDRIVELSRSGSKNKALQVVRTDLEKIINYMDASMETLLKLENMHVQEVMESADQRYRRVVFWITVIITLALGASIILSIVMIQSIARPLKKLTDIAQKVSDGDLRDRVDIRVGDEFGTLGKTFNYMLERMNKNISFLKQEKESIRESHDILEDKVDEQTEKLIETNQVLENEIRERISAEQKALRHGKILNAINEVFLEALNSVSIEKMGMKCIEVAGRLTQSEIGFVGEVNKNGRFNTLAYSSAAWGRCAMPAEQARAVSADMEIRGIWGRVIKDGRPLFTNDLSSHPDSIGTPEGHIELTSFLGVPLKQEGRTAGMIALANKEAGYVDDDMEVIESLSNAFTIAMNHGKTQALLRESEQRYKRLLDAVTDYRYSVEFQGKDIVKTVHSHGCLKITGYSPEEFMMNPHLWQEMIFENDRNAVFEHARLLSEGRPVPPVEHRIVHKDGTIRWIRNITITQYLENGLTEKMKGYEGIIEDITERRRADEFRKQIMDSVLQGIIVIDHEFRILMANRAYCEQVNMTLDNIIGRKCHNINFGFERPCHEMGENCSANSAFQTEMPCEAERNYQSKDGKPVFMELKSYPVKDIKGKTESVIELSNDITEKKRLENQLYHSQKMEAIGQLTGGVAHDFNNILNVIIGFTDIMGMKIPADDPLREPLDEIFKAAERGAKLNQSLLAFSRKQIMEPRQVDLNETVRSIEKILKRLIGEDIMLKTELSDSRMTIMADPAQIDQVLINLATNARDAMPKGGILLIETAVTELDNEFIKKHFYGEPGTYAILSVSDTGSGMDETTREKIFEPFFTTKGVGKGTGLGLATSYGIVKQHNGYINVYSEIGKGTTFKIYLPVIQGEAQETKPKKTIQAKGGGETILVAEDDASLRKFAKSTLESMGYSVILAEDGDDAIEKFNMNKDKISLLLLDLIMPKKNGREVYEFVKEKKPDVKALFLSGYTANIIHKKGIIEKDLHFIMKPVRVSDLLLKVRQVLDS